MSVDNVPKLFLEDASGPSEYAAVFEATDGSDEGTPGGGYLYLVDRKNGKIVEHLEVYKNPDLNVDERDVKIFWSSDGAKCGIAIWGRMRGVINIHNLQARAVLLEDHVSPAVTDLEWLKGFDDYLDQHEFVRARQGYWKEMLKRHDPNVRPSVENDTPVETNFITSVKGPDGWFAVFEDDGDTGYLYVYYSEQQEVVRHLHIYDRSEQLNVAPKDVEVMWSKDGTKCGVAVWNKMRGVIDLNDGEGRVWMESRDTPGIGDKKWLSGFDSAA